MNNNSIGVFDSGLGGLSVWRVLRRTLPDESFVYFADGKNCPYGEKSSSELTGYIVEAVDFMVEQGVKMIVLACNTATAVAIDYLREHYSIPFVGMEPAVKPAALTTQSGRIAVLATKASFKGSLYLASKQRYENMVTIIPSVGEGFVEIVEQGREDEEQSLEQVRKVLEPLLNQGVDKIVLGCTHYPFLRERMEEVVGSRQVEIIDPAAAVAAQAARLLDRYSLRSQVGNEAVDRFYTFANNDYLNALIEKAKSALAEQR